MPTDPADASPPPLDAIKAADAARVADPAAAMEAYLDAVPAERRAKTKAYALGNYVLDLLDAGFEVLVYDGPLRGPAPDAAHVVALGLGGDDRLRDRGRGARSTTRRSVRASWRWRTRRASPPTTGSPLEGYYSAEKESKRQAVNRWIRESRAFDGVLDFDAVLRDPDRPSFMRAAYDSGDHLHPSDAGYQAMAGSIDLNWLLGR